MLEIGTEELPADFARLSLPQLRKMVEHDLLRKRLKYSHIRCSSTPRRIVLLLEGLSSASENKEEDRKGPSESQAFVNGSPTKAALGFAKRFNIEVSALEIRNTNKGKFVFAKVIEEGESAPQLLSELIPLWVSNLQGPRFMRWGGGERRFSRPIRWLVALFDKTIVPVNLIGSDPEISSGASTRGHRLNPARLTISSADEYLSKLTKAGVHVLREKRGAFIRDLINQSALQLNLVPDISQELLEELTDLVEAPFLISGSFDASFLSLPPEVLSTVMRVHQRYVPLYLHGINPDPLSLDSKDILSSNFLLISNGSPSAQDIIRQGNERVLRARLSDAEFFVKVDRSITSTERRNQLNRVTFADGLGTLLDRVERIQWLVKLLISELQLSNLNSADVYKAASFCKHDLVSQMVGEFPELQGTIGAKYLLAEGESKEVALAVHEHYLPKGAGGELPSSDPGAILSLAERIELLISIFSKGDRPSGSSDPYALRRAGNGVLQVIISKFWKLDLNKIIYESINYWNQILPSLNINEHNLQIEIAEFFRQRLMSHFDESGIDIDIVNSISGESIPISRILSDPNDCHIRAKMLMQMRSSGDLIQVQSVVTRASRITSKNNFDTTIISPSLVVDPDLFENESETKMLNILEMLEPIVEENSSDRYLKLAQSLAAGSEAISSFFDGKDSVMVMCDNQSIRNNRLNLLGVLCNQASVLADFDQIKS